jgi:hypothetical protein
VAAAALMSFDQFLQVIIHPALRAVALHWNSARRDRLMPGWRDIDPAAIAPFLAIIWSWKYDRSTDRFVGRLAGEEINASFGKSLRGVPMEEFFANWRYDMIFARHKRVVAEPALAHGIGRVFSHANRHGTGERIIMPLADDGMHGDGILGATVYEAGSARPAGTAPIDPETERVQFFPLP